MNMANEAGKWFPKLGVAPPEWWLSGMSHASAAAQMDSYFVEYSGSNGESGGVPGTRIPPRRPFSAAHSISATEPSTSPRKIWTMPARRSGA